MKKSSDHWHLVNEGLCHRELETGVTSHPIFILVVCNAGPGVTLLAHTGFQPHEIKLQESGVLWTSFVAISRVYFGSTPVETRRSCIKLLTPNFRVICLSFVGHLGDALFLRLSLEGCGATL